MRETQAIRDARDREPNPYRRRFTWPGWNRTINVVEEPGLFKRLPEFQIYTRADHVTLSAALLNNAIAYDQELSDRSTAALQIFGNHGSLISGCVRGHFPAATKNELRDLARAARESFDRSLAHWRAAGRRVETWRRLRDSLL